MNYKKITAILKEEVLAEVEKALLRLHVPGISVTQVKGYGEYQNFYKPDMMSRHARVEIFCRGDEVEAIAHCIMDTAHTGLAGDGVIAVLPVEHLYRIRTKTEPDESGYC